MKDTNEKRCLDQPSRNEQINWETTYRNMKQSYNKKSCLFSSGKINVICECYYRNPDMGKCVLI